MKNGEKLSYLRPGLQNEGAEGDQVDCRGDDPVAADEGRGVEAPVVFPLDDKQHHQLEDTQYLSVKGETYHSRIMNKKRKESKLVCSVNNDLASG